VTTFEPDGAVPEVARIEGERSGPSQDQVNGPVRQEPSPSVLNRLSERNRLNEADAMRIALEEIAAHREARKNLSLSGDDFAARVRAASPSTADDV
jgi:hypothetical protein